MRLTKYGHSCLLIEDQGGRLVVDPGAFSRRAEGCVGIDAILVTHEHPDHLDAEIVRTLVRRNPAAAIYCDFRSNDRFQAMGMSATAVRHGDEFLCGRMTVQVRGQHHAKIHPTLPALPNVGYLVSGKMFVPGDALTTPDSPTEILAVPVAGPWLKLEEAMDYVHEVRPRIVVPVHEAPLADPTRHYELVARHASLCGSVFLNLDNGKSVDV